MTITRQHDFQPDTKIKSSEVNEELNQLVNEANDRETITSDHETRIAVNEAKFTTGEGIEEGIGMKIGDMNIGRNQSGNVIERSSGSGIIQVNAPLETMDSLGVTTTFDAGGLISAHAGINILGGTIMGHYLFPLGSFGTGSANIKYAPNKGTHKDSFETYSQDRHLQDMRNDDTITEQYHIMNWSNASSVRHLLLPRPAIPGVRIRIYVNTAHPQARISVNGSLVGDGKLRRSSDGSLTYEIVVSARAEYEFVSYDTDGGCYWQWRVL